MNPDKKQDNQSQVEPNGEPILDNLTTTSLEAAASDMNLDSTDDVSVSQLDQVAADLTSAAAGGSVSMMGSTVEKNDTEEIGQGSTASIDETTGLDKVEANDLSEVSEIAESSGQLETSQATKTSETSEPPAATVAASDQNESVSPETPNVSFGAVENPDLSDVDTISNYTDAKQETSIISSDNAQSGGVNENTGIDFTEDNPNEGPLIESDLPESSSASFIGDMPKPKEEKTNYEDDEPLVPADPVPGSIGSAIEYSEDAPNHSVPVKKPSKKFFSRDKENDNDITIGKKTVDTKKILIIIGAVLLVAVVAFVLFFVLGNPSKSSTVKKTTQLTTSKVVETNLICNKEGDGKVFTQYPDITSGSEEIIAMYKDRMLISFGDNLELKYDSTDIAESRLSEIRSNYAKLYSSLDYSTDPFGTSFNSKNGTVSISRQADGDKINTASAKLLGIPVLKGELFDDIDSLQETFELQGFTCSTK